jgi:hypothetical protein
MADEILGVDALFMSSKKGQMFKRSEVRELCAQLPIRIVTLHKKYKGLTQLLCEPELLS